MPVGLAALGLWFVVFNWLHDLLGTDVGAANRHAADLQAVERSLGIDIELAVNQWLTRRPEFITPSVLLYRTYYIVLVGVVLWIALRHRDNFARLSRVLVALTVLVLPIWWLFPVSPPRFALAGVVDIVSENDLWGSAGSTTLADGHNHFSAMPSMHTALAAWCAYAVWSVLSTRRPRAARLAWLFPVLMVAVVIATGHHYVLDLVGSAALLALAIAVADSWSRVVDRGRRTSRTDGSGGSSNASAVEDFAQRRHG